MTDSILVEKCKGVDSSQHPVAEAMAEPKQTIQRRAFELFAEQPCSADHALDHWLRAEREVLGWSAGELSEDDGIYAFDLGLPGFAANEVEVAAMPTGLVVHARSKTARKPQGRHVLWSEFGASEVYRRVDLPQAIDVDTTAASFDNGRLHIEAAKATKAAPAAITVRAA